jgi:DNA-3-methyladenine glycosylase
MLNAVCEDEGVGAAALIRALQPIAGEDEMLARRGRPDLCSGPGKLTQALGIELAENGTDLATGSIRVGPRLVGWEDVEVITSAPRVGITHAIELPWRFTAAGNPNVSRPRPRP